MPKDDNQRRDTEAKLRRSQKSWLSRLEPKTANQRPIVERTAILPRFFIEEADLDDLDEEYSYINIDNRTYDVAEWRRNFARNLVFASRDILYCRRFANNKYIKSHIELDKLDHCLNRFESELDRLRAHFYATTQNEIMAESSLKSSDFCEYHTRQCNQILEDLEYLTIYQHKYESACNSAIDAVKLLLSSLIRYLQRDLVHLPTETPTENSPKAPDVDRLVYDIQIALGPIISKFNLSYEARASVSNKLTEIVAQAIASTEQISTTKPYSLVESSTISKDENRIESIRAANVPKWKGREERQIPSEAPSDLNRNPASFIKFHYAPWLREDGTGLVRSDLQYVDPPLYNALAEWLRGPDKRNPNRVANRMPSDLPLPTPKQLTDIEASKQATSDTSNTPEQGDRASKLRRTMRQRESVQRRQDEKKPVTR